MQQNTIRLSLEELAVSLSLLGRPEISKGLLISELGQISPDEEKGRLSAATHTLMTKQVLSLNEGQLRPSTDFARLITPLLDCDFSLRCSRKRERGPELILIFYFRQNLIVKHEIQYDVIHELTKIIDVDRVLMEAASFFNLDDTRPFSMSTEQFTPAQLEEVRQSAAESVSKAKDYLSQQGFPDVFNQLFAEDLHEADYRGSAMRVETSSSNEPISNVGFMLLKGVSGRMWLLDVIPQLDPPCLRVFPAMDIEVREAIQLLLR